MFSKLLKKIAQTLERGGFPYMVIGGQAVLVYGEPRLTRDIADNPAWQTEKISNYRKIY